VTFLAVLLLSVSAYSAPLSKDAVVSVGGSNLEVGAPVGAAEKSLECVAGKVQKTVKRCSLKAADAPFAKSFSHTVAAVNANVHFQGDVVNMSVELSGVSPSALLGELKIKLGEPRVEYWADDEHLFASYIWVDGKTEVELTDTVKGGSGKTILYVASLTGNRPLSPDDKP
jgi:hypothetical protein